MKYLLEPTDAAVKRDLPGKVIEFSFTLSRQSVPT